MDSFSSNRGKQLMAMFQSALVHAQFSPPGQHAFIGKLERWWYPLLVGALVSLRHGGAPRAQWYNAMRNQLDSECILASRLVLEKTPLSGYQRALCKAHDISDKLPFYAPGRFALDRDALATKWEERARPGFWVGRDPEFVMGGKVGSAIWWDGHMHRTVVGNFRIYESRFLDLTADGNKWLPEFPLDSTAEAEARASKPIEPDPPQETHLPQNSNTESVHTKPSAAQARPRRESALQKDYTKRTTAWYVLYAIISSKETLATTAPLTGTSQKKFAQTS